MPFQAVPDTVEINFLQTLNGVAIQNTLHAFNIAGYDQAAIDGLASVMDQAWNDFSKPNQVSALTYLITEVRGLAFENDIIALDASNTGTGNIPTLPLPVNVSLSVKKASNQTGRSARGRMYWCGLGQSQLDANENFILPSAANDIEAGIEALRIAIQGTGWLPVIVSRFNAGVMRPTGVTFPWVSTVLVDNAVDSRRDRLP